MSNIVDECNSISNQSALPFIHSIVAIVEDASDAIILSLLLGFFGSPLLIIFHFERNAKRNEPMTKKKNAKNYNEHKQSSKWKGNSQQIKFQC